VKGRERRERMEGRERRERREMREGREEACVGISPLFSLQISPVAVAQFSPKVISPPQHSITGTRLPSPPLHTSIAGKREHMPVTCKHVTWGFKS
jgi:hypothetical protein